MATKPPHREWGQEGALRDNRFYCFLLNRLVGVECADERNTTVGKPMHLNLTA